MFIKLWNSKPGQSQKNPVCISRKFDQTWDVKNHNNNNNNNDLWSHTDPSVFPFLIYSVWFLLKDRVAQCRSRWNHPCLFNKPLAWHITKHFITLCFSSSPVLVLALTYYYCISHLFKYQDCLTKKEKSLDLDCNILLSLSCLSLKEQGQKKEKGDVEATSVKQ